MKISIDDWRDGMSWEDIINEFDGIDRAIESDNKKWKDPKFINQKMQGMNKGKLRHEVDSEWNECSLHEIKHRGCAGMCPICMLRTYFQEKQSIGDGSLK